MTKVWAVTMMKDEHDIAVDSIRHMASEGVDGIIVADNGSTDGTYEALAELQPELEETYPGLSYVLMVDDDPAYYQSIKMTALAHVAADRGATWIIPFDADELWSSLRPVGEFLRDQPENVTRAEARLFNYFPTDADPSWRIPFQRMVHRSPEVGALPKVAFRWEPNVVIHAGNHGVTLPNGGDAAVTPLIVSHFPYRSYAQFRTKAINGAAAYALTDLSEDIGAHWRAYGRLLEVAGEEGLREHYDRWFHFKRPEDAQLKFDPAPFRRWDHV